MSAPPVRRPLVLALAGVLVLAGTALPASAAVPDPVVTGPVPATTAPGDPAHGYPFLATDYDLAARGYVEEEFFVEGEATRYQADGVTDATVLSTGHAFRTRVVVRRPVDPATFNGTVIAEWYNVSNQWDQEVDWFQTHEHLVREGYAWVGVSAQRAGVHSPTGLRAWSPERYGTLDLTDGGTVTDDTLSWDVFSQAVAAVRDPAGTAPLGPLEAERVVATGHSQSAGRLWSYVNSVDPLAGVVDAVVLHGGGGLLRDDLETPVFKINSETDVAIDLLGAAQRQPDTDLRRTWEVAGASHGDWKLITDYGRLRIRDVGSAPGGYPGTPQTCEEPSGSRVPQHLVQASVYDHVAAWVADGTAPPSAAPITLTDQAPRQVVRDERGLGLGGVRLAQQDVPTRINSGANAGPGFCFLDGGSRPVDDATLAAWYPDAEDYRDAVVASTRAAVEAGFVGADVAADPSWYTDVVDLVDERVAAGTVEPEAGARVQDRMRRALEAADRRDWDVAQTLVQEALALGSTAIEDAGASASVVRSTTAVLGVLALSAALDGPDVSATAVPRCLAGRAYVAVRATNDGAVPADVTLSTPFGERTVAGVAPGASAYQSFSARSATLDAGSALVTATGDGRSSSDDVAYPALDCG
ncbi:alpha/beta hydrolase domain-containing protein [Cellulosimicrobium sp. XJ-DQ-B-000]|uniref:alpha/beta hydrolase domain-containing protein n=1 Tax=Cellulosimicrobium sp. XJ-DQ-B-000 TaxID=3072182 RepID=UPI002809C2B1|nr:alpha/beta hydrolase domain-containing protein [Cellulosimicrobium sp. XJ-DQ-B-000]MDQ8042211.1 alpha/beta hydrolase domain-containing protein [Cellulosimicrobium sp. XJ-DQ-B-000]